MKKIILSIFLWVLSYNAYAILDIEWNNFVRSTVSLDRLIHKEMVNSGNLHSNYELLGHNLLTDFINAVNQSRDPHANRMLKAANINEAESLLSHKQWLFNASQKFERYFSQNPSYIDKKTALELKRYISFLKLLRSQKQFNAVSFRGIKKFLIKKLKKASIRKKGIYYLDVTKETLPTKPKVLRFNSRSFDISVIKNPRYRKSQQPQQSISQNPRPEERLEELPITPHFSDSQQDMEQGGGTAIYIPNVHEKVLVEIFLDGSGENFSFQLEDDFWDKYRDTLQSLCKKSTIKEIIIFTNSPSIKDVSTAKCINFEEFFLSRNHKDYTVNVFPLESTTDSGMEIFVKPKQHANDLLFIMQLLNEKYQ